MEEIKIEFKELDEFTIEDTREVVIQEVPVYPELENLTVTPSGEEQVFNHENSYGYDEVRVEAVPSEALEISPTTENQEFNGIYSNVKVNAVTNEIDSNIVPENIKDGVEILGVKGSFVGGKYAPRFISFARYKGTELDEELANLDTSNITDMTYMFADCDKIVTLDLSNFNTSKVERMDNMFDSCNDLTTLNLSGWDTRNVNYMGDMFRGFSGAELDLSSFVTTNLVNAPRMFDDCKNLKYLNIRNFTFDKVAYSSNMFADVPADCLIIVKGDTERNWILTNGRSDLTNIKIQDEFHIKSIEINADNINIYGDNKTGKVVITYNGGEDNLLFPEEEGYTLTISGNATIDENGIITLNDNAQIGDKLIITAVSTYDSSITATKEIEVVYKEPYYEVASNDGQWVDSGETINGNVVYKSDAGSYNINNGKSIAIIKTFNITTLKLYIRSYAESNYDYTEAFAVDTEAIRDKGLYTTKGKQSNTDYIECIYELNGGNHTIQVMYSKDSSGNNSDDRGYFYVGEYS